MFLSRSLGSDGRVKLALRQGSEAAFLPETGDIGTLALRAAAEGVPLGAYLLRRGPGEPADIAALSAAGRLLPPLPQGKLVLLPATPGQSAQVQPVSPAAGLHIGPGGALEGGVAAIYIMDPAGRPLLLGWLQTHSGSGAATAPRHLSCGPELALAAQAPPHPPELSPAVSGDVRLMQAGGRLTAFTLPRSDTAPPPPCDHPAGTVIVQRLARWLLRPDHGHLGSAVETRSPALGLPLRNPLGPDAADGGDTLETATATAIGTGRQRA